MRILNLQVCLFVCGGFFVVFLMNYMVDCNSHVLGSHTLLIISELLADRLLFHRINCSEFNYTILMILFLNLTCWAHIDLT